MRTLLLALLTLLFAAPALAVLPDDEPANNDTSTAALNLARAGDLVADSGALAIAPGDVDYIGVGSLQAGDSITAVTTPLEDEFFEVPDTILGVFDSTGTLLVLGSFGIPNEDGTGRGLGSLLRFSVPENGDYYIGCQRLCDSGIGEDTFNGDHGETGSYVLTVYYADPGVRSGAELGRRARQRHDRRRHDRARRDWARRRRGHCRRRNARPRGDGSRLPRNDGPDGR